jgi:hypothetical protein
MQSGKVMQRRGNVLDAKEDFICHQCNCVTTTAQGLAKDVFERFPDANVYRIRRRADVPGDITVHGRIVNMYAQLRPGAPSRGDTADERIAWFNMCLLKISQLDPKPKIEETWDRMWTRARRLGSIQTIDHRICSHVWN